MDSGFGDFLQILLSSGILSLFCFSAVLLVVAIVAIGISRRRRAQKRREEADAVMPAFIPNDLTETPTASAPRRAPAVNAPLPDLNMLLDTSGLKKETPEIAESQTPPTPQAAPAAPAPTPTPTTAQTPAASAQPARRSGTSSLTLTNGETVDAGEVMSILRDVVDGDLYVLMGGAVYRGFADESDAKTRFMKIIASTKNLAETPSGGGDDAAGAGKAGETLSFTLNDGGHIEVVRALTIFRDIVDGSLIAQIAGTAYAGLADLPNVKARFLKVMRDAAALAEKSGGKVADLSSAAATSFTAASAPASTTNPPLADLRSAAVSEIPETAPPPPALDGKMPGDLPDFNALKDEPLIPKRRRGERAAPVPEVDIAGAIEAYLQHKLSYTPAYQQRSIHVRSNGTGGVRIEVDGIFYEAVDEVSDPAVRAFLSQTIQEWQERN